MDNSGRKKSIDLNARDVLGMTAFLLYWLLWTKLYCANFLRDILRGFQTL